jgi:hypothetical protein
LQPASISSDIQHYEAGFANRKADGQISHVRHRASGLSWNSQRRAHDLIAMLRISAGHDAYPLRRPSSLIARSEALRHGM